MRASRPDRTERYRTPMQTTTVVVDDININEFPGSERGFAPVHLDGWVMIHASLTRNLEDWEIALRGAKERLTSSKLDGKHASWITLNLATWWSMHAHSMHDHHDAEEKMCVTHTPCLNT